MKTFVSAMVLVASIFATAAVTQPPPAKKPLLVETRTAVVGAMVGSEVGSVLIGGKATWYCGGGSPCTKNYPPGSMVAAAGKELRFPGWRGSWVTVTYEGKSVRVQLVDWCGCPGSRIIDLYRKPFDILADPIRDGVIDVEVTVEGPAPTLPPTDTETP